MFVLGYYLITDYITIFPSYIYIMGQPYDELLYSLIISQLKDDGFYEEADSLQRKVVCRKNATLFFDQQLVHFVPRPVIYPAQGVVGLS